MGLAMMKWHGFGMYGMGGPMSDPGELGFSQRVAHELDVDIHGSPYQDQDAGNIAALIQQLPPEDGVFVWGTSLGANNTPVVCSYVKDRQIDGAFGFQASIYGAKGYALNSNVKFAHLIYSYNPIPLPGLGAYIWPLGDMNPALYHRTRHDIPHPGDYDLHDQNVFIGEMRTIMQAAQASTVSS
jgi:hypothetical protein